MAEGSLVARRTLGRELRKLREAANIMVRQVHEASGLCSQAKLARIEKGQTTVKVGDVLALLRFYGVRDQVVVDALVELAEATASAGWWAEDSRVVPEWLRPYIGLEGIAINLMSYHPELVHGLLQTDDYARAVIHLSPKPEDVVENQLKLRKERQVATLRLDRKISMILGEGALKLCVGSSQIMEAQIAHLRGLSREGFDIRILPFSTGAHEGLQSPFILMDFKTAEDPSVVYLESKAGARCLEQERQVNEYRKAFTALHQRSVRMEEYR